MQGTGSVRRERCGDSRDGDARGRVHDASSTGDDSRADDDCSSEREGSRACVLSCVCECGRRSCERALPASDASRSGPSCSSGAAEGVRAACADDSSAHGIWSLRGRVSRASACLWRTVPSRRRRGDCARSITESGERCAAAGAGRRARCAAVLRRGVIPGVKALSHGVLLLYPGPAYDAHPMRTRC